MLKLVKTLLLKAKLYFGFYRWSSIFNFLVKLQGDKFALDFEHFAQKLKFLWNKKWQIEQMDLLHRNSHILNSKNLINSFVIYEGFVSQLVCHLTSKIFTSE